MAPKRLAYSLLLIFSSGCATGRLEYVPPPTIQRVETSKIIDKPRDAVWNAAVASLGKHFYVINNMDKASGFINLSYTGDPEAYVDCGLISSHVSNLAGPRTYDFPASKGDQAYETMGGGTLFRVHRTMSLEGRINLIFEDLGSDKTRVTISTRYILTRTVVQQAVGGGGL